MKFILTILLLVSFSHGLHAIVQWDRYVFKTDGEFITIHESGKILVAVHYSKVSILRNKLIIQVGSQSVEIEMKERIVVPVLKELRNASK